MGFGCKTEDVNCLLSTKEEFAIRRITKRILTLIFSIALVFTFTFALYIEAEVVGDCSDEECCKEIDFQALEDLSEFDEFIERIIAEAVREFEELHGPGVTLRRTNSRKVESLEEAMLFTEAMLTLVLEGDNFDDLDYPSVISPTNTPILCCTYMMLGSNSTTFCRGFSDSNGVFRCQAVVVMIFDICFNCRAIHNQRTIEHPPHFAGFC